MSRRLVGQVEERVGGRRTKGEWVVEKARRESGGSRIYWRVVGSEGCA